MTRLHPTVVGHGLTDSPGRFVEDPGDHTVYFAPQELCGTDEGTHPDGHGSVGMIPRRDWDPRELS
jgi:hypothetical protein